jgi:serine palmitoyltransferase|uniref:serine C-palmitoyltransferase n=1 Tax=Ostreococcus mediterraneus TaxID=1486918 RepID=A0A7S0KN70_9CHLO|mmetsp:Transcript_7597/g.27807  ORF Transcript_7597/g.27807 Transcript_7597/m.27807 type:complete len:1418 (+) Transcript_7597:185-4438(+)
MEYEDYRPDSKNVALKNPKAYRWLGHTAATYQQYVIYVAEGVAKNTYNALRGIKDWRTDDENGEKNDLLPLSKGKAMDFFYIANLYGNIEDTFNRPIYSSPEDFIDVAIRAPEPSRGYFARLTATPESRRCLNLGSYNYLGFGGVNEHCTPIVEESLTKFAVTTGSPAAELGRDTNLREVEELVARFIGKESACVVGMGFATNSTVIPALCSKGDLIISDSLNHNSIVEGARLSGAKIKPFKHQCVGDLELILQDAVLGGYDYNKIVVIVEGIYSMEGEVCNLKPIVEVCKMYGAHVYLDEAHSVGAVGPTGRGVCEELGVSTDDITIMMGTFTKSFGAAGGYVAGNKDAVEAVKRFSLGYTEAVSMAPAVCAQVLSSLRMITGEDGTDVGKKKLTDLRENSKFFREGLVKMGLEVLGNDPSPIMPVMLYQPYKIGDFSRLAFNRGLAVVVVGSPATPVTLPRVRFCISAAHKREDLENALHVISDIADELSLKFKQYPPNKFFPGSLAQLEAKEHAESIKRCEQASKNRDKALDAIRRRQWAPISRGSKLNEEMKLEDAKVAEFADSNISDSYDMVLSSQDLLDLTKDETMRSQCAETIHRFGLGSCSPRGFYGTFRPHLDLEDKIAKFLGVGEAVLYSFGVCTASSVIQAMTHKSDVAVVDRGVGPSIIAGLRLAKIEVRWYDHADAADAARVFAKIESEDGSTSTRLARPVRRRWLITEACFGATGRVAPLRELVALKDHHHARMILDESFSFGSMGESGRGLTEHVGLSSSAVDVICASLENACASVGGFVAGDTGVVAYQRLMGSGYVFSASLPPYLATASLHAISRIEAEPAMIEKLNDAARRIRSALISGDIPGMTTEADADSPVIPIKLSAGVGSGDENMLLHRIAARMRSKGVGVCVARVSPAILPSHRPAPALRVYAHAQHTSDQIDNMLSLLREAALEILPQHVLESPIPTKRPSLDHQVRLSPRALFTQQSYASNARAHTFDSVELENIRKKMMVEEEVEETKAWKLSLLDADIEEEPKSLSVPLLVILLWSHNLFRRYIIGQINITKHLVPNILTKLGLHPEQVGPIGRTFHVISMWLGSRKFYNLVLPAIVWTVDSSYAQLMMIIYCMFSAAGCLAKGTMSTQSSSKRRANNELGALAPHKVHAWPSVAGVNAAAIPFFILRWRYGSVPLWEMEHPYIVVGDYLIAFAYMAAIVISRLATGDSPANIQGGVVLGAVGLRLVLPFIDWFNSGLQAGTVMTAQGMAFVSLTSAAILLFPVPLNSRGQILAAAQTCYRRMWRTLFYMLAFSMGAIWRQKPDNAVLLPDTTRGWLALIAAKTIIGHIILYVTVSFFASVAKLTFEGALRVYVHQIKPRFQQPGHKSESIGTVHMRKAALYFTEVAQDVTTGLATATLIPRVFDALAI